MSNNLVAAPVLLPLATALVLYTLRDRPGASRIAAITSGVAFVGVAAALVHATWDGAIHVLCVGSWPAEVGIIWVVDGLSAIMLLLTSITSLAVTPFSYAADREPVTARWLPIVQQLMIVGIAGSFVTGDFFNLFVFFEVMLLASFVLISLGARPRQLAVTFPYVIVNLVASALLLIGVGAIYATAGTVNMAGVAARVAAGVPSPFWAAAVLLLVVFATKSALVPLFFWLPDSYPEAPFAMSALFAGLLTKVGVYTLFRSVPLLFGGEAVRARPVLLAIAAATMIIGVLGALGRTRLREILSFHIISQVGYMLFGLALLSAAGVAAGIFYVVHHIVVKSTLFLAVGIVEIKTGTAIAGAANARGIARSHPWIAVAFFVPAMSLAGVPPLSGFGAKLFLIVAGLRLGAYTTTAVAAVVGLLTLASMLKIWSATFWGSPSPSSTISRPRRALLIGPTLALGALSVVIGLAAPLILPYAERVGAQLLAVAPYRDAVLGVGAER